MGIGKTPRDSSPRKRIRRLEDSGLIEPVRGRVRRPPAPLPIKNELAQKWLQEDRGVGGRAGLSRRHPFSDSRECAKGIRWGGE